MVGRALVLNASLSRSRSWPRDGPSSWFYPTRQSYFTVRGTTFTQLGRSSPSHP